MPIACPFIESSGGRSASSSTLGVDGRESINSSYNMREDMREDMRQEMRQEMREDMGQDKRRGTQTMLSKFEAVDSLINNCLGFTKPMACV